MNKVDEILTAAWEELQPRTPRFRYFQKGNGPMFSWTTERFEGYYASFVHYPRGKGSRSGKAELWTMDDESLRPHKLRKDAKARALRLYNEYIEKHERTGQ